jgi:hypothetical protein
MIATALFVFCVPAVVSALAQSNIALLTVSFFLVLNDREFSLRSTFLAY